jgi:hypothetical protein
VRTQDGLRSFKDFAALVRRARELFPKNADVPVFFCQSPLHSKLARSAAECEGLAHPLFVACTTLSDGKTWAYIEPASHDGDALCLEIRTDSVVTRVFWLCFIALGLRFALGRRNFEFYAGNPKTGVTRLFFWALRRAQPRLKTFDDGISNLAKDGYLALTREHAATKWFFELLGRDYVYKRLVNRIEKHYTIYPAPVSFSPAFLLPKSVFHPVPIDPFPDDVRTILVSCPLSEDGVLNRSQEMSFYARLVECYGIQAVLRHPREPRGKYSHLSLIDLESSFLSEDVIMTIAAQRPVKVIGSYSTVLCNLANTPGVELLNVVPRSLFEALKTSHQSILDGLGIPSHELDPT